MYYEICISFYRKSFKSAKSRHSEDFELVRQVFIIQKIIPGDMISYRKKVLVNFFSEQTLLLLVEHFVFLGMLWCQLWRRRYNYWYWAKPGFVQSVE